MATHVARKRSCCFRQRDVPFTWKYGNPRHPRFRCWRDDQVALYIYLAGGNIVAHTGAAPAPKVVVGCVPGITGASAFYNFLSANVVPLQAMCLISISTIAAQEVLFEVLFETAVLYDDERLPCGTFQVVIQLKADRRR